MLHTPIAITALASISALGSTPERVWEAYRQPEHYLSEVLVGDQKVWVGQLPQPLQEAIDTLRRSDLLYKALDATVLFALYTAREAVRRAGWTSATHFGINIGSSRGATALFEKYHRDFIAKEKVSPRSSPTTTLGNIASWVAHDLQSKGPAISHSITCSTALHALLNGIAWLQSGLTDTFLVGGSEAPLTPFTLAQMQALKVYAQAPLGNYTGKEYPCRALDLEKQENTMVLGEAAAVACLEKGESPKALALVEGIGYATERLEHHVSLSAEGQCFQEAMRMALGNIPPEEVDAVVLHAPGTVRGDLAEYRAIINVFGPALPFLTTNKWKAGHSFGASGMLSLEMAVLMLQKQHCIPTPFFTSSTLPESLNRILVNAVGFGGNAVSILLRRSQP